MSLDNDLPAASWLTTIAIAIGGAVYSVFYFVTTTRGQLTAHSERLDRIEDDLSSHMERVETKLDRLILHVGGLRGSAHD